MPNETPCPICQSPFLNANVSQLSALGGNAGEIAGAIGFEVAVVEKHLATCQAQAQNADCDSEGRFSGSDEQLQILLRDSLENYRLAILQQNLVASTSALGVRLRCLVEIGNRSRLQEEREATAGVSDPKNPDTWTAEQRTWFQQVCDGMIESHTKMVNQRETRERHITRASKRNSRNKVAIT